MNSHVAEIHYLSCMTNVGGDSHLNSPLLAYFITFKVKCKLMQTHHGNDIIWPGTQGVPGFGESVDR